MSCTSSHKHIKLQLGHHSNSLMNVSKASSMFTFSATRGTSWERVFCRASCESEFEETWYTPPATCEGFFVRRVVGVKSVAALGCPRGTLAEEAGAAFFAGGGGALVISGISGTFATLPAGAVTFGLGGGPGGLVLGLGGGPGGCNAGAGTAKPSWRISAAKSACDTGAPP